MTQQKDENLVQIQQQCNAYFCRRIFFELRFFLLIRPLKYFILMILTMTKYHENLLSTVKFVSSLDPKMILKIPNETFLRNTLCNSNMRRQVIMTIYLHINKIMTFSRFPLKGLVSSLTLPPFQECRSFIFAVDRGQVLPALGVSCSFVSSSSHLCLFPQTDKRRKRKN